MKFTMGIVVEGKPEDKYERRKKARMYGRRGERKSKKSVTRDEKNEEKMEIRTGSGKQAPRAKAERARQSERSGSSYIGGVSE